MYLEIREKLLSLSTKITKITHFLIPSNFYTSSLQTSIILLYIYFLFLKVKRKFDITLITSSPLVIRDNINDPHKPLPEVTTQPTRKKILKPDQT